MREIGSEFWTNETVNGQELFFVSGRTALDFIIRDIIAEKTVGTVFLPSLCCHSMIEPIKANGLSVSFYDIYFNNGILTAEIPTLQKDDVFFYIEFFGYENQNMGDISQIKKSGCTVIRDATHSWLTDERKNSEEIADYTFLSYRKWTGLTGIGFARKNESNFVISQKPLYHQKYEHLRTVAQEKKKQYIESGLGNKQEFLDAFGEAEELLDRDYIDYLPTPESISSLFNLDKNQIADARRQNAKVLLKGLRKIPGVTPLFPKLGRNDVPLCVPVLVEDNLRDSLRNHLISQQIYCPVHWPVSELHEKISPRTEEIYHSQLSLICDQRYDTNDIKRIIDCVKNFFN